MLARSFLLLVVWGSFATGSFAFAADLKPRDELLRIVPADTTVCFIVQGLRDQARRVVESPFADWATSRLRARLEATPEADQLKSVEQILSTALGVTLADIRDDILGDAVVLSYQFGKDVQHDEERGVILLKPRQEAKLKSFMENLNRVQTLEGSISKLHDRIYRDVPYTERSKSAGRSEYFFFHEGIFAFAMNESTLKEVIDRHTDKKVSSSISKSLEKLGVQDSFMICWIAPRHLDEQMNVSIGSASTATEKAFRTQLSKFWQTVDGIAVYLDVSHSIELGLASSLRREALPEELRSVLTSSKTHSALWSVIPKNALVSVGGRLDAPKLLAAIESFLPAEQRPQFRNDFEQNVGAIVGKDLLPAVLKGIGPDWAIWVSEPEEQNWLPAWTAALGVRSMLEPAVPDAALDAIVSLAHVIRIDYNRKHKDQIRIIDNKDGVPTVKVLSNPSGFPSGFQPSVMLKDGYLVLGSSARVVRRFSASASTSPVPGDVAFLRVSAVGLRSFLQRHIDPISQWLSILQKRPEPEIRTALKTVAEVLEAFEQAELFARTDEHRFRLGVRLTPVKPLSK